MPPDIDLSRVMAPSLLGIFTRSNAAQDRANIQFHVQPLSLDQFGEPLHRSPAITVAVCNLRPTSRGTVRIASGDPNTPTAMIAYKGAGMVLHDARRFSPGHTSIARPASR